MKEICTRPSLIVEAIEIGDACRKDKEVRKAEAEVDYMVRFHNISLVKNTVVLVW